MNYPEKSQEGFTLVEIMIVVVIIGLLAALAIPAFQLVRQRTLNSRMDNDMRLLGGAAQQYFMENSVASVTFGYVATSGQVTGPLAAYVPEIGAGYSFALSGNWAESATVTVGYPAYGISNQYNGLGRRLP